MRKSEQRAREKADKEWERETGTRDHPTVGDLKAFLEKIPNDYRVYAYEGEGGACICVYKHDDWITTTKCFDTGSG